MAIQLTLSDNRFGIDLEYWKIGEARVNWHKETCRVIFLGFVNKAQRDAGKEPPVTKVLSFDGAAFTFTHDSGVIAQVYAKIKALDPWTGGTDVLE